MGILKNKFCENYFRVPNKIFDYALTAGAFQLYCYLLSKPDNWQIINADIKLKLNINSNHTLAKYWSELLDKKFINRQRNKNENNQISGGFDYEILELPDFSIDKNCVLSKISNTKNQQYNNKNDISKNNNINNNNNIKEKNNKKEKSDKIAPKENLSFDYYLFDDEEIVYIERWLNYKKEIKKPLKTQASYTALRNQLLKLKENNTLKPSIDICIANGWTGLYEQKHFINKETKTTHDIFKNVERTGDIVITDW